MLYNSGKMCSITVRLGKKTSDSLYTALLIFDRCVILNIMEIQFDTCTITSCATVTLPWLFKANCTRWEGNLKIFRTLQPRH